MEAKRCITLPVEIGEYPIQGTGTRHRIYGRQDKLHTQCNHWATWPRELGSDGVTRTSLSKVSDT